MTLRSRLAWTLGTVVVVSVVVFAALSVAIIDQASRTALDARLTTAASAVLAIVDVTHGRPTIDPDDREILANSLSNVVNVGIFHNGQLVYTNVIPLPHDVPTPGSSQPSAFFSAGRDDRAVRGRIEPIVRGGTAVGTLVVWQNSNYIGELDRNALGAFALGAVLVGLIVVLLSSLFARRALAPLANVTELATEIEAHDLSRRLRVGRRDELGLLASAFDRMLDRLQAAFERQRQFSADASHELRAPLAVIRAEADVALAKERSGREYREALETITSEVERMDALVTALLVTARADAAQMRFEPVEVGAIALLTAERFAPSARARCIRIDTNIGEATIEGDGAALERALDAIVHNAIEFATSVVAITVEAHSQEVAICIQDDGPGFSDEGLLHATERFWRADTARVRGSTGLGLAIADAIARAHGGRVSLENAQPKGARVQLVLRSSQGNPDV